ncbi:hypothetical protein JXA05_02125 [Candidatus Peregrinibacteria bacterium]|nr:hypothetical protein [Candidatus Peregrinibacteria bacterium]
MRPYNIPTPKEPESQNIMAWLRTKKTKLMAILGLGTGIGIMFNAGLDHDAKATKISPPDKKPDIVRHVTAEELRREKILAQEAEVEKFRKWIDRITAEPPSEEDGAQPQPTAPEEKIQEGEADEDQNEIAYCEKQNEIWNYFNPGGIGYNDFKLIGGRKMDNHYYDEKQKKWAHTDEYNWMIRLEYKGNKDIELNLIVERDGGYTVSIPGTAHSMNFDDKNKIVEMLGQLITNYYADKNK